MSNDKYGKAALSRAESSGNVIARDADRFLHVNKIVDVAVPNKAKNAAAPLAIPTFDEGLQQPTHPSVVYIPNGWNGFRYWMAHTPFPFGAGDHENPHIVASHDGINWVYPEGISNPIFPQPQRGYYSDVDLLYHPEEDRLYLFWRYVEASYTNEMILVSHSDDGVTWSKEVITFKDTKIMLSPSFVFDGSKFHMWYAASDDILKPVTGETITIRYRESKTPFGPWSEATDTNMKGLFLRNNDVGAWHIDVNKYADEYHMLINSNNYDLYMATSRDMINWEFNKSSPILTKSGNGTGKFDASKIYRATGVLEEGVLPKYKIWYGATGDVNDWTIGYTELLLGPSSITVRPKDANETAVLVEGRTDQATPLIDINARNFNKKAFVLKYNNAERLYYELGSGLRVLNDNDHIVLGSESGVKGRFVTNPTTLFMQAGRSGSDNEAVIRFTRYLSTANIKSFEVFADSALFKGDLELDGGTKGIILKSPDGSRWKVSVGNDGVLATNKVT